MSANKNKMWIVEIKNNGIAYDGIAYIGRDPKRDPKATAKADNKGKFLGWASKSLGYPVVFKDKKEAQKFARRARKAFTVSKAYVTEVEFYKGEMEGD